ncbi:MAG: Tim44/TimA family putative adaptor protein [Acetobacteraceae bacterium]
MDNFSQYFDIILFAMVAGFLILRLRSVLGRRTGTEKRRDNLLQRQRPAADKAAGAANGNQRLPPPAAAADDPVATGLLRVHSADPEFEPQQFLDGARIAFDMIVAAFAAGDKDKLRPLLSDEVFKPFAGAIDQRNLAKETLETRVLRLKTTDIADAGVDGRMARVTIKFVSDQINVIRAHDGSIVDGNPAEPIEKTDYWTFGRDTRSADPNWLLTATGSGGSHEV